MNNHVVVTRLLYKDYYDFRKRLELYKETALDCLKKQTNQSFDIAVLCNPEHQEDIRELGIIPFFRKDRQLGGHVGKYWHTMTPWENIEGLKKYKIQTNLDSDDIASADYIEKIKSIARGDKSLHIHFQPRLYNYNTGEEKKTNIRYNNSGSMFYSLYQPTGKYTYIGHDSHKEMGSYASKSILVGEGYAWLTIHDNNDSSTWNT